MIAVSRRNHIILSNIFFYQTNTYESIFTLTNTFEITFYLTNTFLITIEDLFLFDDAKVRRFCELTKLLTDLCIKNAFLLTYINYLCSHTTVISPLP